jgi:dimethylglycine dehydrogenase
MPEKNVPHTACVVIVGGGIMGCGLAYHLAHDGWSDVVLLEKAELTSGSTWHAAGQITHSTSSYGLVRMVDCNIDLYAHALEAETGQDVTWHGCGSFRLAYTEDEMDWLRHTLSVGRSLEINIELVGPDFIAAKHPLYNLDGVLGALWTPDDGHVDPSNVTMALAAGACAKGARIIRRCRATNITRTPSGEWLVETVRGAITCEHVVNAGGTYARQMGEWSRLQLPMTSMTHHYFVTEEVPEFRDLDRELPVIRDDRLVSGYIRMEQKKGLIGIYEKEKPNSVWEDHCPWEAENELFAADYDRVMSWLEAAMDRMPAFAELGITREVHGAISHPPDGNPLVGPAPGVRNYWCSCGTQIGIGWGPGLTRELARWMVHGSADISMRDYDPRRFGPYATKEWQVIKAKEDYCLRHEIPFPHFNRLAGCPIKPSPLFDRLKDKGAVHEEVYGFERPRWFARDGVAPVDHYSLRRGVVDEMVAADVKAVRESVGITDITAFTKVRVAGSGAVAFLDRLVANRLPQKVGGRHPHPYAEPKGPDRAGNDYCQVGRGRLLPRLRSLFRATPAGSPERQSRGRGCENYLAVRGLGGAGAERPQGARRSGCLHRRGPVQCRFQLAHGTRHRCRRAQGSGLANVIRGRVELGDAYSTRKCARSLLGAAGHGRRAWHCRLRQFRHERDAHGKGVSGCQRTQ